MPRQTTQINTRELKCVSVASFAILMPILSLTYLTIIHLLTFLNLGKNMLRDCATRQLIYVGSGILVMKMPGRFHFIPTVMKSMKHLFSTMAAFSAPLKKLLKLRPFIYKNRYHYHVRTTNSVAQFKEPCSLVKSLCLPKSESLTLHAHDAKPPVFFRSFSEGMNSWQEARKKSCIISEFVLYLHCVCFWIIDRRCATNESVST